MSYEDKANIVFNHADRNNKSPMKNSIELLKGSGTSALETFAHLTATDDASGFASQRP